MSRQDILTDLSEGLLAEKRALDLCQFLLTVLTDENDKKIISKIAQDEKKHVKVVEGLIKIVEKNFIGE